MTRQIPLPTEHFEMAPLSEFVVTFKDHMPKAKLPQISWFIWYNEQYPKPEIDLRSNNVGENVHVKNINRPKDVEVVFLPDCFEGKHGYYVTFADDPEPT